MSKAHTKHTTNRKYPESFFKDLYGRESSDTEFADFLIEQLIAPDFHWLSKVMYEQRFDIHNILVEYYKEGKPTSEIAKKRGVLYSNVNNHRNWGLRYIRCVIGRNTNPVIHPVDFIAPRYYPVTFSEYNDIREKCRHHIIEYPSTEKTDLQSQNPHLLDSKDNLQSLDLSARVYNALYGYGIKTVEEFICLSGNEKIPKLGNASWAEIRKAQIEARERLVEK